MEPQLMYSMHDAILSRNEMIENAQRDYERECKKAEDKFLARKRAADRAFEDSRRLAKRYGHARAQMWRKFHKFSDMELRTRYLIVEQRLRPERAVRLTLHDRIEQTWYKRMIENEMLRRDPERELIVEPLPPRLAASLPERLARQRDRREDVQRKMVYPSTASFRAGLGVVVPPVAS